ncbi:MAG: hypothetical protein PHG05_00105 [Candidatus Nanoarchaeia archaeon]|nr:hypothetical protein [Candidatus Nanoarchaeia archaeon]
MNKKGQTEIIGLVVIVILFVIIGSFFLVFSSKNKNTETKDVIKTSKFMPAFLEYTPCLDSNVKMEEIIRDCNNDEIAPCQNLNCRDFIRKTLEPSLNEFFGKEYRFSITKTGKGFIEIGNCTGNNMISENYQAGGFGENRFEITLAICKN